MIKYPELANFSDVLEMALQTRGNINIAIGEFSALDTITKVYVEYDIDSIIDCLAEHDMLPPGAQSEWNACSKDPDFR